MWTFLKKLLTCNHKSKPPVSIPAAYWPHPSMEDRNSNKHHPSEVTVWVCQESGKRLYGSTRIIWPFRGTAWAFNANYDSDSRGYKGWDREKRKSFDDLKQWCLENCTGRWAWSSEENKFFVDSGIRSGVGHYIHRYYHLLIESEEDAVLFRLVCDETASPNKYPTLHDVTEEVRLHNEVVGWEQHQLEQNT